MQSISHWAAAKQQHVDVLQDDAPVRICFVLPEERLDVRSRAFGLTPKVRHRLLPEHAHRTTPPTIAMAKPALMMHIFLAR